MLFQVRRFRGVQWCWGGCSVCLAIGWLGLSGRRYSSGLRFGADSGVLVRLRVPNHINFHWGDWFAGQADSGGGFIRESVVVSAYMIRVRDLETSTSPFWAS